ncbi:RNA-directed DNA polymerase, eukaryota [Tanacetum coccineum]
MSRSGQPILYVFINLTINIDNSHLMLILCDFEGNNGLDDVHVDIDVKDVDQTNVTTVIVPFEQERNVDRLMLETFQTIARPRIVHLIGLDNYTTRDTWCCRLDMDSEEEANQVFCYLWHLFQECRCSDIEITKKEGCLEKLDGTAKMQFRTLDGRNDAEVLAKGAMEFFGKSWDLEYKLMGINIPHDVVASTASSIGCATLTTPFNYLGVKVGSGIMSRLSSWDDVTAKLSSRLSKWKLKTLSIGNGDATSFWDDVWLVDSTLKYLFPMLNSLELHKLGSVAVKEEQLWLLVDNISSVVLSQSSNRWVWRLDSLGNFSMKSASRFIDDSFPPKEVPTRWVKSIPIKVNIFAWKVCLDKVPTRLKLSLRGLDIPSVICPLCSTVVESTAHLLFSCHLAR